MNTKFSSPIQSSNQKRQIFTYWRNFKYSLKKNIDSDPQLKESIDNFKDKRDKFLNKYSIPKRYNLLKETIIEIPSNLGLMKRAIFKYTGIEYFMENFSIHSFRTRNAFKTTGDIIYKPRADYEEDRLKLPKNEHLDKHSDVFRKRYKLSQYIPAPDLTGVPMLLLFYIYVGDKFENWLLRFEERILSKFIKKEEEEAANSKKEFLRNLEIMKRRMFLTHREEVGYIVYAGETQYLGYLLGDSEFKTNFFVRRSLIDPPKQKKYNFKQDTGKKEIKYDKTVKKKFIIII